MPVHCLAGELGVQVGQVALQQGSVYLRQPMCQIFLTLPASRSTFTAGEARNAAKRLTARTRGRHPARHRQPPGRRAAGGGTLAEGLPVSRSAVSQHLKVLKDADLVSERAACTRRVYRLNPAAVAALRDQLDTFWQRALASYVDVAEQATEESP